MLRKIPWTTITKNVRNLAHVIALGVAGFWAYTTFVYPEVYRPEEYQNYLTLSSDVLSIDFVEEMAFVRLNLTATNSSKSLLRNIAAHYEISGVQIADKNGPQQSIDMHAVAKKLNEENISLSGGRAKSFSSSPVTKTLDVGLLMLPREWFVSGEAFERNILVEVPRDIDAIAVNISVVHQNDKPHSFRPIWNVSGDGHLWFKLEVKEDDESDIWQPYKINKSLHRELAEDRGLLHKYHMAELIVPWPKCSESCELLEESAGI